MTTEIRGQTALLRLSGRLVFDESLFKLHPKVRELLQQGADSFIFDCSQVPHCDSSGCGEIIAAYVAITKAGASAAFIDPTERVRVVWDRIRLLEILRIFKTIPEAETFFQERRKG
jgi:anti-anti-sigma factor